MENIEELPYFGITDFLGAKKGLKRVSRIGVFDRKINQLKNRVKESGMKIRIVENNIYGGRKEKIAYIGKEIEDIKKIIEAEKKGDRARTGELLGYPKCCAKSFSEKDMGKDNILTDIWESSKANAVMNSLFNFSGRKHVMEGSIKEIYPKALYYIPHHPCSLECAESLEIGRQIKQILNEEAPKFAKRLENVTEGNFIYINDFNFASFEGKNLEEGKRIDEVREDFSCFKNSEYSDAFDKADKIVENNGLKFYRDDRLLLETERGKMTEFKHTHKNP